MYASRQSGALAMPVDRSLANRSAFLNYIIASPNLSNEIRANALRERAAIYLHSRKERSAISDLQLAIRLNPNDWRVLSLLYKLLYEDAATRFDALEMLDQVLQNPNLSVQTRKIALERRADLHLENLDYHLAAADLRLALRLDPYDAGNLKALKNFYNRLDGLSRDHWMWCHRPEATCNILIDIIENDPAISAQLGTDEKAMAFQYRAKFYYQKTRYAEAMADTNRSLEFQNDPEVLLLQNKIRLYNSAATVYHSINAAVSSAMSLVANRG